MVFVENYLKHTFSKELGVVVLQIFLWFSKVKNCGTIDINFGYCAMFWIFKLLEDFTHN